MTLRIALALVATTLTAQRAETLNPPCVVASVVADPNDYTLVDVSVTNNCQVPYTLTVGLKYMASGVRVAESSAGIVFINMQPHEQATVRQLSDWQDFTHAVPTPMIREVVAK